MKSSVDKSRLNGEQLFDYYTSLDSPEDRDYAQVLNTAFLTINEDLFPLLEKAEKEGKIIVLLNEIDDVDVMDTPLIVSIK